MQHGTMHRRFNGGQDAAEAFPGAGKNYREEFGESIGSH